MTRINIELPEELHKRIKVVCAMRGVTIREFLTDSLSSELLNEGKQKKQSTKTREVYK